MKTVEWDFWQYCKDTQLDIPYIDYFYLLKEQTNIFDLDMNAL